jgi:hypothetical protein
MHRAPPRAWSQLQYLDPERILSGLREIALTHPLEKLPYEVATLRTRGLRRYGEGRQAAFFCYGLGQAIGARVQVAQTAQEDFDIVARYVAEDELRYVPVQLKEWVPDTVNPSTTLEAELGKLVKYGNAQDLVVAFHLNRTAHIKFSELQLPAVNLGALWFYGAKDATQREWWLIGNLLRDGPVAHQFIYPGA